ncbi:MAG: hypothetical protein CM1200mP29_06520 [Verrucomicrobiota bacterium]|nr:MAG: hypothetical protein CM1200mP29_06520 [Verrucomicrobiota bacterium]
MGKMIGLSPANGVSKRGGDQAEYTNDDGHGCQRTTIETGMLHQISNCFEVFLSPVSVHGLTLFTKYMYTSIFFLFFDEKSSGVLLFYRFLQCRN